MDEYKIIITPDAETDLNELDDYISFYLMAPDIAISCIRYIRSKIAGLRKAPKRYRLIEDEPWHSRGIRRMNAKNFAVFFFCRQNCRRDLLQRGVFDLNYAHIVTGLCFFERSVRNLSGKKFASRMSLNFYKPVLASCRKRAPKIGGVVSSRAGDSRFRQIKRAVHKGII